MEDRGALRPYLEPILVEVGCYSGYRANERPVWFVLAGERKKVVSIVDRWYGVEHDYFKVSADDGKVYMLKWHRQLDLWYLVSEGKRLGEH